MKKFLMLIMLFGLISHNAIYAQNPISGKVNHDDLNYYNKIIDSTTQQPLSNAKITIPEIHYTTYSDKNGAFQLNADLTEKTVLFVEKDGYKVFSLTVDNSVLKNPLKQFR